MKPLELKAVNVRCLNMLPKQCFHNPTDDKKIANVFGLTLSTIAKTLSSAACASQITTLDEYLNLQVVGHFAGQNNFFSRLSLKVRHKCISILSIFLSYSLVTGTP